MGLGSDPGSMLRPWRCISSQLQQLRRVRGFGHEAPASDSQFSRIGVGEENKPVTMKTSDVMVKALENENIE